MRFQVAWNLRSGPARHPGRRDDLAMRPRQSATVGWHGDANSPDPSPSPSSTRLAHLPGKDKKNPRSSDYLTRVYLEAETGIEPMSTDLQSAA